MVIVIYYVYVVFDELDKYCEGVYWLWYDLLDILDISVFDC